MNYKSVRCCANSWLRSPGRSTTTASNLNTNGNVNADNTVTNANSVRPDSL